MFDVCVYIHKFSTWNSFNHLQALISIDPVRAREDPVIVKNVPYYKAKKALEGEVMKLEPPPRPQNWGVRVYSNLLFLIVFVHFYHLKWLLSIDRNWIFRWMLLLGLRRISKIRKSYMRRRFFLMPKEKLPISSWMPSGKPNGVKKRLVASSNSELLFYPESTRRCHAPNICCISDRLCIYSQGNESNDA